MAKITTIRHENHELELRFERRRYGTTTYTWVYVNLAGDWVSLGDPWPCITPKRSEIAAAVSAAISMRRTPAN